MSNIAKTKEAQTDEDFGIGYEEAFQQLKGLEILEESERLEKEVELLPQFAGFVPESITLEGFRDLIGKMTPNILLYQTKTMRTFLHEMADDANVIALNALLAVGPEEYREIVDKNGKTALHIAAGFWGNVNCVEALLKDSCPEFREMTNKHNETALHVAVFHKKAGCVEALLKGSRSEYRAMIDKDHQTGLHIAAKNMHLESFKALLKDSPPEYREIANKDGKTALHIVAAKGKMEQFKALLKDSRLHYREIVDKRGYTPLHVAADWGQSQFVQELLKDSSPNYFEVLNKDGEKPIDLTRNKRVIRFLLEAKYEALVLSIGARILSTLDEKYRFWSDDCIAKDTLLWLIGDEYCEKT